MGAGTGGKRQEGTLWDDGSILYLSWGASYPGTQFVKIPSTFLTSIPFTVCKFQLNLKKKRQTVLPHSQYISLAG